MQCPQVEVYTSAWTVTHDENNFRDPYVFKPERWLDPDRKDNLEASQPFSLGLRGCLGKKCVSRTMQYTFPNRLPRADSLPLYFYSFALVEVNLIMAKLHFAYDLELRDANLDWLQQSHMHVMWRKPAMHVRFSPAKR